MAPYEVQPDTFKIKFTTVDKNITPTDFLHNQELSCKLGKIEERYYADKLAAALNPVQQSDEN